MCFILFDLFGRSVLSQYFGETMDLLCVEQLNMTDSCVAERDRVIFDDMRVLDNLLQLERVFMPPCNYFGTVQKDILPFMRKVVATWMMEVSKGRPRPTTRIINLYALEGSI